IGSQGADSLADGLHHLTARVQIVDPQLPAHQTGFGDRSASVDITVDTASPAGFFGTQASATDGLDPASDSGVVGDPASFTDRITNVTTPSFFGTAEANAIVRVFTDADGNLATTNDQVQLGLQVAVPLDGTNAFPNGQWNVTST